MKRFLIIGGGAAGMLASVYAARNGMEVHLFEQNEKLGKKLFITGKGLPDFLHQLLAVYISLCHTTADIPFG